MSFEKAKDSYQKMVDSLIDDSTVKDTVTNQTVTLAQSYEYYVEVLKLEITLNQIKGKIADLHEIDNLILVFNFRGPYTAQLTKLYLNRVKEQLKDTNVILVGEGLFSEKGIRIYHVDARIDYTESKSLISIFKFNNSYTEHRLISLVQASGLNTINYNKFSTNADLFKASMSYKFNSWYSSSNVNFIMNVESLGEKAVLNFSII